jgi:ubiquinone/menaquinone biosynthesis C-methylase UbiE
MHTEDYVDLFNTEENLWWFVGMRKISDALLEGFRQSKFESVLDIGCGTGLNLQWLRQYTQEAGIQGLDIELTALEFCRQRGEKLLVQSSATELPFTDESFDLVTNFDVLVQLVGRNADDMAIAEMFRVLKPNGLAFVRVAAYEWMKSGHDESLRTQRRYSLGEISQKLEDGGFTVLRKTYANSLLFPVAFFKRKVLQSLGLSGKSSDVKPFPPSLEWLNRIFTRLLLIEARFLRFGKARLPFGLSAICIVRKS